MGTVEPSVRATDVGTAFSSTSTVVPPPAATTPPVGFCSTRLSCANCVGVAPPKADVTVSAAVCDGSTGGGVPVGDAYGTTLVQLGGFAPPPKTNELAAQVPPAREYDVLPVRAEVKFNGVSATLLTV